MVSGSQNAAGSKTITAVAPATRFAVLLAAALLVLSGLSLGRAQAPQSQGITVNGAGTAYGSPDTAAVDLCGKFDQATVSEGMAAVAEMMQAISRALVEAGVEASDIRTSGLSVWREQQFDRDGLPTRDRYNFWQN